MKTRSALVPLKVSKTESLPPNEVKAADIFSRMKYSFAEAVADLIDNSIDASASKVLIRMVWSAVGIQQIIIADNGAV